MNSRPSLILAFAFAFAFFILVPAFLGQPFPAYDLMHWADVLDLFTPLVLIPLYWLLFTDAGRIPPSRALALAFAFLGALWAEGQGMHLAANSIGNLLGAGSTGVHNLVHFYDEVLSHYLWHIAIVGLSVLLLAAPRGAQAGPPPVRWAIIVPSAILYGFTYFAAVVEGGTVPFGLPAAVLVLLGLLLTRRASLRSDNLTAFFFTAYLLALVLLGAWFARWGGFPQFTETGIL
jgi:hypothetical protein